MFVILWEELAPTRILITIASVLMVAQLRRGRIPLEPVVNQEVFEVQNYSGEFLRLCKKTTHNPGISCSWTLLHKIWCRFFHNHTI